MAFAENLRAARIAAGMTQEALALACGWSGQSRIANYESTSPSAREPKVSEVPLLAKALGVSIGSLFGETGTLSQDGSHPARLNIETIAAAVNVLKHYLELVGDPLEWVSDPVLLETAHEVVLEFGSPVTVSNVLDLTKRLGKKIRGNDDSEQQMGGARQASG